MRARHRTEEENGSQRGRMCLEGRVGTDDETAFEIDGQLSWSW